MRIPLPPRLDAVFGLRGRLTAAFLATALVMGLPAAGGVYLLMMAGEQVSFLTGSVTPMRVESGALVGNLHALRDALQVGLSGRLARQGAAVGGADPEAIGTRLDGIGRDWAAAIARLRVLAGQAGVDLPIARAERAHAEAMRLAAALLAADRAEFAAAAARDERLGVFRAARQRMDGMLRDVAARANAQMTLAEEQAKTTEQAQTATTESLAGVLSEVLTGIYPRLIGADRLLQGLVQLDEAAAGHAVQRSAATLDGIEAEVAGILRNGGVYLRRLAGRLQGVGQAEQARDAAAALGEIRTALLGSGGAFARQREALAAAAGAEVCRMALIDVEEDLRGLLSEVARQTLALEQSVTADARRWSREALAGLLAAGLGATILALCLGLASARRLTAPLQRLNEAVAAMAEGRSVTSLAGLLGRDDIGSAAASVLERTAHLATHDALTGLPNRALFRDRLTQCLAECHREGGAVAVLYLDLDKFKEVNDSLGHAAGDRLLVQVATRLRATLRESDTLARLGGDEFAIVQRGVSQPIDAEALCLRIIATVAEPFDLDGHQANIGISIGVAMRAAAGMAVDPGILIQESDVALYRSKEEGRGIFRFFQEEMNLRLLKRKALEADLRRALAEGELRLHYQPQVSTDGLRLVGAEALIRWQHPVRGDIRPDQFIPLAEETGLIVPIGDWVMRTACRQAAGWPELRRIAVNVSPVQFRQPGFVAKVRETLAESGLAASRLELEITESILLNDTEEMLAILAELRALGVSIAMDDFGTGYSSLGYLRKFRFDKIKIDRSFVRNLSGGSDSAAIIRAVLGMSHALGIRSNAEGVEEAEQMALLGQEGCEEAQGFLFGRPMPAEEFAAVIAAHGTGGHCQAVERWPK
ncbi:putative bifunctional diguanylate cyclase/phosphodiesterase [Paracraurococcus ruber]|uniref:Diguanylate cyclase (GGDEF) domain-containing protein n=1 Tax=Paracraurococcus ruber TaxID=77675 RepID=A0ABS1D2S8_9PROT|nr:EAL domain-containing protein [Paracraurococcus ruber]MBK1660577.1 hypothetical protein [Paracraurococcus ruber]TDG27334.1 EAL domain-containing protein [Paracraurococcus ruber]